MAQSNEFSALLPSYGQEARITNSGVYRETVYRLLRASVAPETRRAYASRLKHFFTWCEDEGISAFPASSELLASYIASLADEGYVLFDGSSDRGGYRGSTQGKWINLTHREPAGEEDRQRV